MSETIDLRFDTKGNKKQLEASRYWLDKTTNIIVYGGSKNSGKTYLLISLIFGDAFTKPNTRYFIARKTGADLVKHTIPSIYEVFDHWGITENMYKFDGKNNVWTLYNGSKILFIDCSYKPSDPMYERFGSQQYTRGAIEEAGEFSREAMANLFISIGRCKNEEYKMTKKLLMTCNPSKNFLYEDYYIKHKEGTLSSKKKFVQALPQDNTTMTKDYYEGLLDMLDENGIQRLLYGNWEFDDNPMALFDYNKILGLYTNEYVKPTGKMYMTCDIAYEGSDIFTIAIWNGFVLEKIIAIDKINEVLVSNKIHELRLRYGVPISNVIYDADGTKKFIINSAKEGNLKGAIQFRNNRRAYGKENYANLKVQCYFKLAEYVDKGLIYVADRGNKDELIKELEQIQKLPLEDDGKIRLEKKSDLKLRLGRSPDFADMMMMRMFTEVKHFLPFKVRWN